MTDIADNANDTAQFNNDVAIRQHAIDHALPAQHVVDGVVECMDCDDEIPAERLEALPDCVRCFECQTAHEIRERQ